MKKSNVSAGASRLLLCLFLLLTPRLVAAQPVVGEDTSPGDRFGQSLSASTSGSAELVVGAPEELAGTGSAYVFIKSNATFLQRQKLNASPLVADARFGAAVAVHGDWLVVGAPQDDTAGVAAGAVYVFSRDGDDWLQAEVLVPASAVAGSLLGHSVAVDDNILVIGAPGAGSVGEGAVFIYRRVGSAWVFDAELGPSNPGAGDLFGASVAVSDQVVVVGATGRSEVTIYGDAGAGVWQVEALVDEAATGCTGCDIGTSVASRSGLVLLGAPGAGSGSGGAFALTFESDAWGVPTALTPIAAPGSGLGRAVAVDGDVLVLASEVASGGAGAVSTFDAGTGAETGQRFGGADEEFGAAVAASEGQVLVGSPGAAGGGFVTIECLGQADTDLDGIDDPCDSCPDNPPIGPPAGSALSFAGAQAAVAGASGPLGAMPRSYVLYARTTAPGPQVLFSYGDRSTAGAYLALTFQSGALVLDIGGGVTATYPAPQVDIDHWHHYAVVIPDIPSPTLQDVILFQDAVALEPSGVVEATPIATSDATPLTVGRHASGAPSAFEGLLDEFQIWDRAFNRSEILVVIKGGNIFGSTILGAWSFDEGGGPAAADSTGAANDLILESGAASPGWSAATIDPDHLDPDSDGLGSRCDLCLGDNATGDFDADGRCGDIDTDDDGDGVPDDLDQCLGDDASGDDDLNQVCNDIDPDDDGDGILDPFDDCAGDDASGDWDDDGVCDDLDEDDDNDGTPDVTDPCLGALNLDFDGDGLCDDVDTDDDGDGVPDSADVCQGDDTSGDTDGDGVCDDLDTDDDGDGIPDDEDLCLGNNAFGDTDGDGLCDDLDDDDDGDGVLDADDGCTGLTSDIDTDGDGWCNDIDPCVTKAPLAPPSASSVALALDGTDRLTATMSAPSGGSPRTLLAWAATPVTGAHPLFAYGDDQTPGAAVSLALVGEAVVVSIGGGAVASYPAPRVDGGWHQYALVVPDIPGVTFADLEVYQDGARLELDGTPQGTLLATLPGATVRFGAALDGGDGLEGFLGEVALFDRALSRDEILEARAASPAADELGLLALWLFNEGTGTSSASLAAASGGAQDANFGPAGQAPSWSTAPAPRHSDGDLDGIGTACDTCVGVNTTGDPDDDGLCNDVDTDDDGDGTPDIADGCSGDNTTGDTDGDGVCNNLDDDDDGDGIPDGSDSCLGDNATGDTDGDGVCDNLDDDDDGDGIDDAADLCLGDNATGDTDGDGVCDDLDGDDDGDGIGDAEDLCTGTDASGDFDGDGVCDDVDADDDDDDILDGEDLCLGDNSSGDTDEDGTCDDADADDDGDGILDVNDACLGGNSSGDTDGDGICDDLDDDDDGDGVLDGADLCLGDDLSGDSDGDGTCDDTDADDDNDGVDDASDNCPVVANPTQSDIDGDTAGDPCDEDQDGDTIDNALDNCPTVANPDQIDTDGDGQGDACEGDTDDDGIVDVSDNCVDVANADQADLDGDAVGDACDDDIDGDGLTNAEELTATSDPRDSDSDDDGLSDGVEVNTHGTDPVLFDTDGGGVGDGDEVSSGLDPKDPADDWTTTTVSGGSALGCSGTSSKGFPWAVLCLLPWLFRRRGTGE